MWLFTVASLTTRRAAISELLSPAAIRMSTSASRGVSPSGGVADPVRAPPAATASTSSRCTAGSITA